MIHLEPAGTTQDLVGIETVRNPDQINQGGAMDFISAIARRTGPREHIGGFGGYVDIGNFEDGGLRECRRGNEDGEEGSEIRISAYY